MFFQIVILPNSRIHGLQVVVYIGDVYKRQVCGKPLPFRSSIETFKSDDYLKIEKALKASLKKVLVIDDCQYLLSNAFMRRARETGYQKFTEFAVDFWTLVHMVINELPEDVLVYFLGHIERDANGKMCIRDSRYGPLVANLHGGDPAFSYKASDIAGI